MAYETIYYTNEYGETDSYDIWVPDPEPVIPDYTNDTPPPPDYSYDIPATEPSVDWTAYGYTPNGDGTFTFKDSVGNSYIIDGTSGQVLDQYSTAGRSTAGADSTDPIYSGDPGLASGTDSSWSLGGIANKLSGIWTGLSDKQKAALIGAGVSGIQQLTGIGGGSGSGSGSGGSKFSIPQLSMARAAVPNAANTAADYLKGGAQGKRYFSDALYGAPSQQAGLSAVAQAQAVNLAAEQQQRRVAQNNAMQNQNTTVQAATGGVMPGGDDMNGYAHGGRYLQGGTDGMADELAANIDGKQPAKLSHGEFVIPADVVSHLGNGNSDAGARKLYDMMAKIRKARTGSAKQGKQINPDKFMPGGIAKLAVGGEVPGFAGTTGSQVTAPAGSTGTSQSISDWAAPYVTNMLGQAQAAANQPYQAYQGPLTAGQSALQTQVTGALTNTNVNPNYGKSFTDTGVQQQYMNPYLQGVLTPQLDEMRRQSQITQMGNDAKMVNAGAFGGSRQAILTAENQRNLMQQQDTATGKAYSDAYTQGMNQFNTEQGQAKALLDQKSQVGATDRGIVSEGIAADKAQFEQERDNPYKMLQFQQSLLQGLPLQNTQYQYPDPSWFDQLAAGAKTGQGLYDLLYPSTTTAATTGTKP